MKVLIACEESQEVCKAFREKGHEAYSCDMVDCSGGHPEWHIKENCLPMINGGVVFKTVDGKSHECAGVWDLIIAHPPCTYLTSTGNRWFKDEFGMAARSRYLDRMDAIRLFMGFVLCSAKRVAIENPVGIMSGVYRKPDQIIQPYEYGHPSRKATCLWLRNLPLLKPTNIVEPELKCYINKDGRLTRYSADYGTGYEKEASARRRSKTYSGIAKAMANQWG